MKVPSIVFAWILLIITVTPAFADSVARGSNRLSNASGLSAAGSGLIVEGTYSILAVGGRFVVDSVVVVGKAARLSLTSSVDASKIVVEVAANTVAKASLAAGKSVEAVAEVGGMSLMYLGKVIAFIPNESGRAMIHQSRRGSGD